MPLVSDNGIPPSKRGRRTESVDLVAFFNERGEDIEAQVQELKENLGTAYGYENILPKIAKAVRREYGVDVKQRNVRPKEGNIGEMWITWPAYNDDEDNLVEDEDAVKENLES